LAALSSQCSASHGLPLVLQLVGGDLATAADLDRWAATLRLIHERRIQAVLEAFVVRAVARAQYALRDVVSPEIGGAHVAAGDLDRFVAGLAHDVMELRLELGGGGGETGAEAVARVSGEKVPCCYGSTEGRSCRPSLWWFTGRRPSLQA
jgi:hypothetical protein